MLFVFIWGKIKEEKSPQPFSWYDSLKTLGCFQRLVLGGRVGKIFPFASNSKQLKTDELRNFPWKIWVILLEASWEWETCPRAMGFEGTSAWCELEALFLSHIPCWCPWCSGRWLDRKQGFRVLTVLVYMLSYLFTSKASNVSKPHFAHL